MSKNSDDLIVAAGKPDDDCGCEAPPVPEDCCGGGDPQTYDVGIDSVSTHVERCLEKCLPEGGIGAVTGDTSAYITCLAECILLAFAGETLSAVRKDNKSIDEIFKKLEKLKKDFGDRIVDAAKKAGFDLSKEYTTIEKMREGIKEIEKLKPDATLTEAQKSALAENLRRAINETFSTGTKASIAAQAKLGRWRFIDQLAPEAKAALVAALNAAGVPLPDYLK